jgi:hypothetical protein
VAELEQAPAADCCSATAQATCCEPDHKAECCGENRSRRGGCGCAAGQGEDVDLEADRASA